MVLTTVVIRPASNTWIWLNVNERLKYEAANREAKEWLEHHHVKMSVFSGQQCSYSRKHIGTKMSYW